MVTPRFAPFVGGVETHVAEVAIRLVRQQVAVTVLTIDPSGAHPQREWMRGIEVRRYPARVAGGFSWQLRTALAAQGADAYDLVHVQGVHTALPALALDAARRARLPTVLTFHTGGHSSRMRRAARGGQWRALRSSLRSVDRLVAVCEYEIAEFASRTGIPPSRFSLIRNGAEPLEVDASDLPALRGNPLVLSVARLERYKGHHRLIAALPELLELAPEAHLGIVGTGPQEASLRRQANRLGVCGAVSFVCFGPGQRSELGALLATADVMALMSDYEAHPISVMEAVALGVPTLVSRGSGLTELAAQGLVEAVSARARPAELAATLLRTARRTGRPGPLVSLPTWDDAARDLLALYQDLVP